MVYAANIVTVAEMQLMAGAGVSATVDVDANHIVLQDHAEGYLSTFLKFKLDAAGWGTLDATTKVLITEWAARYAGATMIAYDTSGYITLMEAEDMINIHLYRMQQIEKLLESDGIQDFIGTNT